MHPSPRRFPPSVAFAILLLASAPQARAQPSPLPSPDPLLQSQLAEALDGLGLSRCLAERRLAVSLLDISDPARPRYAGFNDREMMYAASLPKIAILLAGFERIRSGRMAYTPETKAMFTRLARYSSNEDASRAIQLIGFPYIARVLRSPRYRLYDPRRNGGLWLGKAYGGPNDRWLRDPLHNISHGASSSQTARFFWMLDEGQLVSPRYSAEIKKILSNPGVHHKFVKGLDDLPGRRICRKSGTWRRWHSDAALVEAGDKKYIAVALMEDPAGGTVLTRLIGEFDRLVCGAPSPSLARLPGRPTLD